MSQIDELEKATKKYERCASNYISHMMLGVCWDLLIQAEFMRAQDRDKGAVDLLKQSIEYNKEKELQSFK